MCVCGCMGGLYLWPVCKPYGVEIYFVNIFGRGRENSLHDSVCNSSKTIREGGVTSEEQEKKEGQSLSVPFCPFLLTSE